MFRRKMDRVELQDVRPVDEDPAARRLDETVDHAQRGGLATARGSDENAQLAVGHRETQFPHRHRVGAVALGHPVERDHSEQGYPPSFPLPLPIAGNGHRPGIVDPMLFGTGPFFKWSYVTGNWSQIQGQLLQHIALSLIAVAIGTAISIPLAVLAWRYHVIKTPVFGVASTLYVIPSLALFAILGPITGFVASYTTAEIALVGYTLLILIWNTVAGLDAVPADAREAATALGYSKTARSFGWTSRSPCRTSSPGSEWPRRP